MFPNLIAIRRVRTLHKSMSSEALGNFYKFYTISMKADLVIIKIIRSAMSIVFTGHDKVYTHERHCPKDVP